MAVWTAGIAVLLVAYTGSSQRARSRAIPAPAHREAVALNAEAVRFATAGLSQLVPDLLWLQFLQDDALTHLKKGERPSSLHALDLATDLDRAFLNAYVGGAQTYSVIRDDGASAAYLLEKAARFMESAAFDEYRSAWSEGWWVPMLQGYVYLFELDDIERASKGFAEAAAWPQAPEHLSGLARRLRTREGRYEAAIRLVRFMQLTTNSEKKREHLKHKEAELLKSQYFLNLNRNEGGQPIQKKFEELIRRSGPLDPWGQRLVLRADGRIDSMTPREAHFGLRD
ncbi:MAG: hypothetical protein IT285_11210 [Bdellovibrionales bacterium]|nr:hypothetical protein [Bdellovibrionales bacterium]